MATTARDSKLKREWRQFQKQIDEWLEGCPSTRGFDLRQEAQKTLEKLDSSELWHLREMLQGLVAWREKAAREAGAEDVRAAVRNALDAPSPDSSL